MTPKILKILHVFEDVCHFGTPPWIYVYAFQGGVPKWHQVNYAFQGGVPKWYQVNFLVLPLEGRQIFQKFHFSEKM